MIRCLAVDDEPLALKQLVNYIEQVPFLSLAGSCRCASAASKFLEDNMVDVMFLDIDMPGMNGLDFV